MQTKYTLLTGRVYMTGVQALVRMTLDLQRDDRQQGLRTATFVSGYPGSPLGGLDLELHRVQPLLRQLDIFHSPGVNEELAATAVLGTQTVGAFPGAKYDGVSGIWYGKAPGLDRASDALKHLNFIGTDRKGGVLFLVGDDPASKSSSLPSDSIPALYDALVPTLYPGNVQEVLEMGMHGLTLSRICGLAVGLKIVTDVADSSGTVEVSPDRFRPVIPVLERAGQPFVHTPFLGFLPTGSVALEGTLTAERMELARLYARANQLNRVTVSTDGAWLGIAAAGKTYHELRQALQDLGLDDTVLRRCGIRLLQIGMVFPLEPQIIREFSRGLAEILVVEEKRPFIELFIKDILYGGADQPVVVGKQDEQGLPLLPISGQLNADQIAVVVGRRLGQRLTVESVTDRLQYLDRRSRSLEELLPVVRTAFFCSGCPHNRSTVVPEGSLAAGGIGCHGMATFLRSDTIGNTPMGDEGAQWIGIAPFTETSHIYQNMGDGTLFHSGLLAIRGAVSANVNITYRLLYNEVVAMTGGQLPVGVLPIPELIQCLVADKVQRIIVTTDDLAKWRGVPLAGNAEVWHRDRLPEAMTTLAALSGVTALIHDQHCSADLRRLRKRDQPAAVPARVWINERVCEGCADCAQQSNCLSVQSVETEFGRKTQIHQSSCNLDQTCLLGDCPALVTVKPGKLAAVNVAHAAPPNTPLPEPMLKVPADRFSLRMLGIGGTGVVTLNQILATAALLDGKHVQGIDQTGVSQKAGPVVSDLRILATEAEGVSRLSVGQADLYLALDLLVATDATHLTRADSARTLAVVSTSQVPTGQMVINPDIRYPNQKLLRGRIDRTTRSDLNVYLDAIEMAEALLGDHMAANVIMLGAAYQAGGLPLSAAAIEQAIRLNGVTVEKNLLAFRWGRVAVANPCAVEAAVSGTKAEPAAAQQSDRVRHLIDETGATGELRRVLEIRVPELIRYQNEAYAREYLSFVQKVSTAEHSRLPGRTTVAEAAARYLFKLMAYKDEYEVARLHLETGAQARSATGFGADATVHWHLNPPMFRSLFGGKKLVLGPWFTPVFKALRALKVLRGTVFDPFGYAAQRGMERRLVHEYRELVDAATIHLSAANHATVVALAELPDQIRGYEEIKLRSVAVFREQAAQLLVQIEQSGELESARLAVR